MLNDTRTNLTKENYRTSIDIWKTGSQKYILTLDSEMQLNSLNIKNTVATNIILQIKDIQKKEFILDILSYDKEMTSCNNEGIQQMFTVTRHFEKLYDEFKVVISKDGTLKSIENFNYLQNKWKKIKNDSLQYFDTETDIESFFNLDEKTVNDQDFWIKALNEQEILFLYFGLSGYGTKFSSVERLRRENAFKTGAIDWVLQKTAKQELHKAPFNIVQEVTGVFEPSKKWMKKGYGKMPFFEGIPFKEDFNIKGNYLFDAESGFIKQATITVNEIVHPSILFHKLKYTLTPIE